MAETDTAPHRMVTVTLRFLTVPAVDVPGEPTPITGVYLTPLIAAYRSGYGYSGTWGLTHAASGRSFPLQYDDPEIVRALADALAEACPDWTALDEDPKQWPAETRDAVVAAARRFREQRALEEIEECGYFSGRTLPSDAV